MTHAPGCRHLSYYGHYYDVDVYYDITGVRIEHCWSCRRTEYGAIELQGAGHVGRLLPGGLFDASDPAVEKYMSLPAAEQIRRPIPTIKNPVSLAFDPAELVQVDDGKDHDGVSLRTLWFDDVARTIWLGLKPFVLTSQYFRAGCIAEADRLRAHPERLLDERVYIAVESALGGSVPCEFTGQLTGYLIWALHHQGFWPYFYPADICELRWIAQRKAAA